MLNNQKSHGGRKRRFADEIGERYGETECRDDKVLQPWRGSGGIRDCPV